MNHQWGDIIWGLMLVTALTLCVVVAAWGYAL